MTRDDPRRRPIAMAMIPGGSMSQQLHADDARRYTRRELGYGTLTAFLDNASEEQIAHVQRILRIA